MAGEPVVTDQSTDEERKENESGEIVDISEGGDKKVTETLVKEESSSPEVTAVQFEDKEKSSAPIESISIQDTSTSNTPQIEDSVKVTDDEFGVSPVIEEMKKVTENDLIPSSDTSVKNDPQVERTQPEQNLKDTNEPAVVAEAKTIAIVLIDPQTIPKVENEVGKGSMESFVAVEDGKNIPESEPSSGLDNLADNGDQIIVIKPEDKTKDAGESVIVDSIKTIASDYSVPSPDILMDDKSQIVDVSEKKLHETVISDKFIEDIEPREEEAKALPVLEQLNRVLADGGDEISITEPEDKTKDAGETVIVESIKTIASDYSIPSSDILMDDKPQIVAVSEKKLDETVISNKSIEDIEHREEEPKPLPVIEKLNKVLVKLEEDQTQKSEQDIKKEVKEILESVNQIIEEPPSTVATLAVEPEKKSEEKVEETSVPELSPQVAVEMKKEIDLDRKGLTEKKIEDVDSKPVESQKEEHDITEESIAETNSGKNQDECRANAHVSSNQGTDAAIVTTEAVTDDKLKADEGSKVPEIIIREVKDTKKEETGNITATELVTLKNKGSTEISPGIITATELVETLEEEGLAEISSDVASVANISESHNVEEKVEAKDTKKEETGNITATELVTLKDKGSTEISPGIITATELVETLEEKGLAEISSDIASVANISESHNVEEKVEAKDTKKEETGNIIPTELETLKDAEISSDIVSVANISEVDNSINIDSATVISEKFLGGEKISRYGDTVTEEKEKIKEEKALVKSTNAGEEQGSTLAKPTNAGEEQGSTKSKSQTKLEDLLQAEQKEIVVKVGEDEADKKKEDETEENTTQNLIKDSDSLQTDRDLQKDVLSNKSAPRSSNNLLSKVKKGIVKIKKAIVGKSPSSKTLASDTKTETKEA